jgi:TatA/E family protein of Tat protein translocase
MLSPSDTLLILIVALLLFGPEQLPKIARRLAEGLRGMQATTHTFMLEMERAAASSDAHLSEPAEAEAEKVEDDGVKPAESLDANP